jgi:hypothetical protein
MSTNNPSSFDATIAQSAQAMELLSTHLRTITSNTIGICREDIVNYLDAPKTLGIALRKQDQIVGLAISEVMDVSFMIKTDGVILRIPILIGESHYFKELLAELLTTAATSYQIVTMLIDVSPSESQKAELLHTLGFRRFCAWYRKQVVASLRSHETRLLNEGDVERVVEMTHIRRLNRQRIAPCFWTLAKDAKQNHRQFMRTVLADKENIAVGIDISGQLAAFAIAMPRKNALSFGIALNVRECAPSRLLIDDCQALDGTIAEKLLPDIFSHIAEIGRERGFGEIGFVCSVYDVEVETFILNYGWELEYEWHAIAADEFAGGGVRPR